MTINANARNIKKVFVFLLICFCMLTIFSAGGVVSAQTNEERLEELEKEIESSENNVAAQEELLEILLSEIEALDVQINQTNALIDDYSNQKEETEKKLEAAQKELDEATANKVYYQKLFEERLSVMYMYGDSGYLDVLFGSTSISDFISRIDMISSIVSYDREIATNLEIAENTIQEKKEEIEVENQKLADLIGNLSQQEANLETQKNQKNKKTADIEENIIYWNALAKQQEDEAAELRRIIAASNSGGTYGNDFSSFSWPVPGRTGISDYFGYRMHPIFHERRMHYGIDIPAPYNTPVIAPGNGKVIYAQYRYSFGNCVIIDLGVNPNDGDEYSMLFAHLNHISVSVGDIVTEGQTIGLVGSTGHSTGPHLHFSVLINNVYVDPLNYVSR